MYYEIYSQASHLSTPRSLRPISRLATALPSPTRGSLYTPGPHLKTVCWERPRPLPILSRHWPLSCLSVPVPRSEVCFTCHERHAPSQPRHVSENCAILGLPGPHNPSGELVTSVSPEALPRSHAVRIDAPVRPPTWRAWPTCVVMIDGVHGLYAYEGPENSSILLWTSRFDVIEGAAPPGDCCFAPRACGPRCGSCHSSRTRWLS